MTLKYLFLRKNVFILSLCTATFFMDIITFPKNLLTTSGLSILMHDVISLPDALSYDKMESYVHGSVLVNLLNLLQN